MSLNIFLFFDPQFVQIPDHPFEHDAISPNPNAACPGWQFISMPINPAKVGTLDTCPRLHV